MNPEDEAKIRKILDEALRGGPKPYRMIRVTGTLKTPGSVQYQMRHLSFTVEEELPADKKRSDMVREVCEELGPLVLEFEKKTSKPERAKANSSPLQEPTPELTPEFLDTLGWKPFPDGGGEWIFADTPGAQALDDELSRTSQPVEIDNYRYRVSWGKPDKEGRRRKFLNRSPVVAKK